MLRQINAEEIGEAIRTVKRDIALPATHLFYRQPLPKANASPNAPPPP